MGLAIDGGVARLSLERPEKLNSFTRAMHGDLQAELGRSADYNEGVNAFLEKRAPRFTGR